MTPAEVFHQAHARVREYDLAYTDWFAPDGVLELPFAPPPMPRRVQGRDAIRALLEPRYAAARAAGRRIVEYANLRIHQTTDPEVIVAEFEPVRRNAPPDFRNLYPLIGDFLLKVNEAGTIESLALSPDGRSVVGGCRDGSARVWDAGTGAIRHVLVQSDVRDPGEVSRVEFSPDGRTVMTARGQVAFWDAATGARRPIDHMWGPIALSPDWRIAVCRDAEGARLVEVKAGRVIQLFTG